MTTGIATEIDVDQLAFDVRNPRLAEFSESPIQNEMDIMKILWDTEDVQELVLSITASGFFRHEPLIVVEESGEVCRNRREPSIGSSQGYPEPRGGPTSAGQYSSSVPRPARQT